MCMSAFGSIRWLALGGRESRGQLVSRPSSQAGLFASRSGKKLIYSRVGCRPIALLLHITKCLPVANFLSYVFLVGTVRDRGRIWCYHHIRTTITSGISVPVAFAYCRRGRELVPLLCKSRPMQSPRTSTMLTRPTLPSSAKRPALVGAHHIHTGLRSEYFTYRTSIKSDLDSLTRTRSQKR